METRTPLFVGLTRPPMLFGIPFQWVVLSIMASFVLFMLTKAFASYLLYVALHMFGLALTRFEPNFMTILMVRLRKTPPVPNASYWGANSYEP